MHTLQTLFSKCSLKLQIVPNSVRIHARSCFLTCLWSSTIALQIVLECTILLFMFSKYSGGADPLSHAPLTRNPRSAPDIYTMHTFIYIYQRYDIATFAMPYAKKILYTTFNLVCSRTYKVGMCYSLFEYFHIWIYLHHFVTYMAIPT